MQLPPFVTLLDAADHQPEHSSVVYDSDKFMLQRTLVVEEDGLESAFEQVPWSRLVFLKCDRQQGSKRILLYRWRAE